MQYEWWSVRHFFFFFSSRRRHTRFDCDWSSDVCSSDLTDTRSGAVNGARSDQSNITLDGVDVNADTKGYAFTSVLPITQDSVQEFREIGRASCRERV